MSVKELNKQAEEVLTNKSTEGAFPWVKCIITDIEEPVMVKRCSNAGCKGRIETGTCKKCSQSGAGVYQYLIKLEVMCYDDHKEKTTVVAVDKGGKSLFGMTAEQFHSLGAADRALAVKKITFKPVAMNASISYDVKWNTVSVFPFVFNIMDKAQARASPALKAYMLEMTA